MIQRMMISTTDIILSSPRNPFVWVSDGNSFKTIGCNIFHCFVMGFLSKLNANVCPLFVSGFIRKVYGILLCQLIVTMIFITVFLYV